MLGPISSAVKSPTVEVTQGMACDKEYGGDLNLTSAATLQEISEVIRQNTDWTYDEFLERAVLIGFDEIKVGFRPIFEQKNSLKK